ncbi:MAG: PaaI family thioesterase [Ignavibacteria bacterium]|nr:PaaI family thioesterase [Ignavibacteria bacterium]
MRNIKNPFAKSDNYGCFGCKPDNPSGLSMTFFEEDDKVVSRWTPKELFQGYGHVLHGGIQATLADEIASWFINVKLKTAGVTSKLEIEYLKPVYVNRGEIILEAVLGEMRGQDAVIHVNIMDSAGTVCAKSVVTYYTFPPKIAERKLNYPGYEAFFEQ